MKILKTLKIFLAVVAILIGLSLSTWVNIPAAPKASAQARVPLMLKPAAPVAPVVAPAPVVEETPTPEPEPVQQPTNGCGDNFYANYIYMHESGCRTTAVNSLGCRGIGQSCPGSKLPCGDDYACQNEWFTHYAYARYGGWAGAYSFWLGHGYW